MMISQCLGFGVSGIYLPMFPILMNILPIAIERQRRRVAHKLAANTEDRFSHFTRWKATMEYAKTKDILHVMKLLGHKSIKNTLIYTQLVEGIKDDEYIYKIARTPNEISNLIEAGFEYVCEHD